MPELYSTSKGSVRLLGLIVTLKEAWINYYTDFQINGSGYRNILWEDEKSQLGECRSGSLSSSTKTENDRYWSWSNTCVTPRVPEWHFPYICVGVLSFFIFVMCPKYLTCIVFVFHPLFIVNAHNLSPRFVTPFLMWHGLYYMCGAPVVIKERKIITIIIIVIFVC